MASTIKQQIKSAQKSLDLLIKSGAPESAIKNQQKVVNTLEEEASKEETYKVSVNTIATLIFDLEINGDNNNLISKKLARVRSNRPINEAQSDKFIKIISDGEYEEACPIIAMLGEDVVNKGQDIVALDGNVVSKEEASDYIAILDGQHRAYAMAQLIHAKVRTTIPNVVLRSPSNIGSYLVSINKANRNWDATDKASVASLTTSCHKELFSAISNLVSEGFNYTTACLILTGKQMSATKISRALSGSHIDLPEGAKFDASRAQRFITLCKKAGLAVKDITKRYFIKGFNSYAIAVGEESAFKALEHLSLSDVQIKRIKNDDAFIPLLREALTNMSNEESSINKNSSKIVITGEQHFVSEPNPSTTPNNTPAVDGDISDGNTSEVINKDNSMESTSLGNTDTVVDVHDEDATNNIPIKESGGIIDKDDAQQVQSNGQDKTTSSSRPVN